MDCEVIKSNFFSIFFCLGLFSLSLVLSFASSAENSIDEKNKQLCYLKDKHLNDNIYTYNNRNFSIKNDGSSSRPFKSIVVARSDVFTRSPWELKRAQVNVGPSVRSPSITHWFKYDNSRKNRLNQLCKTMTKECIFKVVYNGDIYPGISAIGDQVLYYKNTLRATIYDTQNNILRFPANCP